MTITISQLTIYPLKSASPINLEQTQVGKKGLEKDRNWMLIDKDRVVVTARDCPAMLKIEGHPTQSGIIFTAPEKGEIELAIPDGNHQKTTVGIWSNNITATLVNDQADQWFSEYLEIDCQLVYMRDEDVRAVPPKAGGQEGDVVSFADENPLLLITEASLAELNSRLEHPVSALNFRSNIVVTGSAAFSEDSWTRVRIGDATYRVAQACKRCILTTIDPKQAKIRDDREPLKTLAKFRYDPDRSGVLFGIHVIPENEFSEIRIGDELIVIA